MPSPILASLEYLRNQNAHLQGKRSRSEAKSDGGRVQNEVRRKSKGGCVCVCGGGDGGSDPIVLSLDWRP